MLRRFVSPKWWGLHALLVGSLLLCYRLGLWQWTKGHRSYGSWVNLAYGVQWWVFAAFAVFLYAKLVLDELDPSSPEEREARQARSQPPLPPVVQRQAPAPADDEDDELAAYNRYLQSLHQKGSAR